VIGPRLKLWAGLILAGLMFFLTFGRVKLQQGRLAERADQAEATVKAVESGAKGAARAQRQLQDGKTPDEIRRANDARWD
jgi:regulator of protease activity HflC (stomatin/prohibitin superfamily)